MNEQRAVEAVLQLVDNPNHVLAAPGIYALWCQEADRVSLLSIRPCEDLHRAIATYHQLQNWRVHSGNKIIFSLRYMPGTLPDEREAAAQAFKEAVKTGALCTP